MTSILGAKSERRVSAEFVAGLVIAGALMFGALVVSADADERHDNRRGGDHRSDRGHDGGWGGGYRAPPVVYGAPGYYPPPVVYGPAVGISLPGVSIGIR
jgi:hypothetical protein